MSSVLGGSNEESSAGIPKPQQGPLPSRREVHACQFSSWYATFANLPPNELGRKNVTVPSEILNLPETFRDYLLCDGVQLPAGARTSGMLAMSGVGDDESVWSSDSEAEEVPNELFHFSALNSAIDAAIRRLGGLVAPKLNWSSPKDAIWVNGGTLQCKTAGDVYLLLKSSDFCAFDIQHSWKEVSDGDDTSDETATDCHGAIPLQLVLRKWCNLYPSQEFRCFVREQELVAVSQRQHSQHFEHLVRDQYLIRSLVVEFFDEIIKPHSQSLNNYTFDVYLDKKERVWLVDFNVWGRRTDPLLFTWDELPCLPTTDTAIRVVETEKQVRADPLSSYRAPIDTVHVASLTGGDSSKFQEFMDLCERPTVLESELLDAHDE
jgi:hypothetical protein